MRWITPLAWILGAVACGGEGGVPNAGAAGSGSGTGAAGIGGSGGESSTTTAGGGAGAPVKPPADGAVPVFVAQGRLGRTTVSCDDGMSWVGNHSWDLDGNELMCGIVQDVRCGEDTCSYTLNDECVELECCNDTSDVPEGVAYGNDRFVGAWGHGHPGALRTSVDGIEWNTTYESSPAFSIVFGGGRFVAVSNHRTAWSTDGMEWNQGGDADFQNSDGTKTGSPVRSAGYGDYMGGGRVVAITAGGGSRDMLISSDGGETWWRPTLPALCAAGGTGTSGGDILAANDILLVVDGNGNACRSTDGGESWSVAPTGLTSITTHGVWTGSEFLFWGATERASSPDGETWTKTALTDPAPRLGPIARADSGTLVAHGYIFHGYEKQKFFRSTDDGLTWEQLPTTAYLQSHSIFRISFGYADPSALCPVR